MEPAASPAAAHERLAWSRVAAAVLGWPGLAFFLFLAPGWAFLLLVLIVAGVALSELYDLCELPKGGARGVPIALTLGVCAASSIAGPRGLVASLAAASLLLGTAALVETTGDLRADSARSGVTAAGMVYLALPLSLLLLLRREPGGGTIVGLIVLANWARDIGAFLAGRALGGRPLRRDLNPRKHLGGAIGGLVLAGLALMGLHRAVGGTPPAGLLLALAIAIGVFGQVGDLFGSLLKRRAGHRHSGRLLADQGGVLDAIDGLLFSAPAAYLCMTLGRRAGELLAS
jgi:phosphatidate cytidylyltransferase